jgi:lactobin A/cerein 7B family class IIb bacteriocin
VKIAYSGFLERKEEVMDQKRAMEVFSDESFVRELLAMESEEQMQEALEEKGVEMTMDEIRQLVEFKRKVENGEISKEQLQRIADGELSEDELEEVAGGGILLGIVFLGLVATAILGVTFAGGFFAGYFAK